MVASVNAIQIKKLPDGRILARRADGRPPTEADRAEAQRLAQKIELPAVDQAIDDQTIAVLIDSTVLGSPIWFSLRDGWAPDEAGNIPIFYASELPALRQKTPEQLRSIFNVKRSFGGMVRR